MRTQAACAPRRWEKSGWFKLGNSEGLVLAAAQLLRVSRDLSFPPLDFSGNFAPKRLRDRPISGELVGYGAEAEDEMNVTHPVSKAGEVIRSELFHTGRNSERPLARVVAFRTAGEVLARVVKSGAFDSSPLLPPAKSSGCATSAHTIS